MLSFLNQTFCWQSNTQHFRGNFYQKVSVPTINTLHTIKAKGSSKLLNIWQFIDKNAYKKQIKHIESQFKKIENDLRLKEKDAVIAILKKYNIDNSAIEFGFRILNELKNYGAEYMSNHQEDIFHHETMFLTMMTKN